MKCWEFLDNLSDFSCCEEGLCSVETYTKQSQQNGEDATGYVTVAKYESIFFPRECSIFLVQAETRINTVAKFEFVDELGVLYIG
jgi:hypothetical protein